MIPSIIAEIPINIKSQLNGINSPGFGDIFVQLEYAFHNKDRYLYANQATIVWNIISPTESENNLNSPISFGGPSTFIGFTASHVNPEWYIFGSSGVVFGIPYHNSKIGNKFLYQCGICRNIDYVPSKRILSVLIEFFGIYSQRDKLGDIKDRHTGGNTVYIGPTMWFATQKFIFTIGIAFAASQPKRFLNKENYFFAAEIGWKFN